MEIPEDEPVNEVFVPLDVNGTDELEDLEESNMVQAPGSRNIGRHHRHRKGHI